MTTWMQRLASPWVTLVGIATLSVTVLMGYRYDTGMVVWLVGPLGLLGANLVAAIASDGRFRRNVPLLGMHLSFAAVVLFAVLGKLIYLHGTVELLAGESFSPERLEVTEQGVWHYADLNDIAFEQESLRVRYGRYLRRVSTQSRVRVPGEGGVQSVAVGDDGPLLINGYRLYATSNKGFGAVLTWRDENGREAVGAVHFPSFPALSESQVNTWRTPAGSDLELTFDADVEVPETTEWLLEGAGPEPTLTIKVENEGTTLRRGESMVLPGGRLRFDEVRMWMGYWVYFEPTMSWLLAASFASVLFAGWHFWRGLRVTPALRTIRGAERGVAAHV